MLINAYLNFDGQCEEAFKFYEQVLGGQIIAMINAGSTPMAEHTAPERRHKIIHARLRVGDNVLMGSDAPPEHRQAPQGFAVSIGVDDPAEAERIFAAFAAGGKVDMALQKTFWAEKFGMVTDCFGTPWMINCEGAQA
jgi:PhnB protein